MKYMGSKNRIAKYILPIILKDRKPDQWYVEPFAGGMNSMDKVTGKRLAGDSNEYLIAMWKELLAGWTPPKITREEYYRVKESKDSYPAFLVGWVGFCCSYCGKWFDGFAGNGKTAIGTVRDYQEEAIRNIRAQMRGLDGVVMEAAGYQELRIPPESIIYCDPPYGDARGYGFRFDNARFWEWCREKVLEGHTVFVSEYKAPEPFRCLWQGELKSTLSVNGKTGWCKTSVEKLFSLSWVDVI